MLSTPDSDKAPERATDNSQQDEEAKAERMEFYQSYFKKHAIPAVSSAIKTKKAEFIMFFKDSPEYDQAIEKIKATREAILSSKNRRFWQSDENKEFLQFLHTFEKTLLTHYNEINLMAPPEVWVLIMQYLTHFEQFPLRESCRYFAELYNTAPSQEYTTEKKQEALKAGIKKGETLRNKVAKADSYFFATRTEQALESFYQLYCNALMKAPKETEAAEKWLWEGLEIYLKEIRIPDLVKYLMERIQSKETKEVIVWCECFFKSHPISDQTNLIEPKLPMLMLLGTAHFMAKNYEQAKDAFLLGLQVPWKKRPLEKYNITLPFNPLLMSNLMVTAQVLGQTDDALSLASKAFNRLNDERIYSDGRSYQTHGDKYQKKPPNILIIHQILPITEIIPREQIQELAREYQNEKMNKEDKGDMPGFTKNT